MNNIDRLDWTSLCYALAALRAKTLAGAARSLGVETSTVARRLAALEVALGVRLLTRGDGGLTPTAVGRQVMPLLESIERSALGVRVLATSRRERLRLATPPTFNRLLALPLATFQAKNPEVILEIVTGACPIDVKRREVDVALRSEAPGVADENDDDLVVKRGGELGWSLYASTTYLARRSAPIDAYALEGHDAIGAEANSAMLPWAGWVERFGRGARVVMRCRDLNDALAACVAGVGLAVLPCRVAALEPALERLTPARLASSRLSLVYRKEPVTSDPLKALIGSVIEALRGQTDEVLDAVRAFGQCGGGPAI